MIDKEQIHLLVVAEEEAALKRLQLKKKNTDDVAEDDVHMVI
jgi:hypothetical protein